MKTPSLVVEYWTGEINSILSSVATAFSGWLAPIPEAAMTSQAIIKIFELSPTLAVLVAASIELVGVSVNAHYLDIVAYNATEETEKERRGRKTHVNGLENVASARNSVIAFYCVTGLIVTCAAVFEVVVGGAPLIKLLAVLFPVASASGTLTMNKRAAFHRKQQVYKVISRKPATAKKVDLVLTEATPSKQDRIHELRKVNPELTQVKIAEAVGVSTGYVSRVLKANGSSSDN